MCMSERKYQYQWDCNLPSLKAGIHSVPVKSGRDLSVPAFTSLTLDVSVCLPSAERCRISVGDPAAAAVSSSEPFK